MGDSPVRYVIYDKIVFMYYSTTIKLLLLLILIKGSYLSLNYTFGQPKHLGNRHLTRLWPVRSAILPASVGDIQCQITKVIVNTIRKHVFQTHLCCPNLKDCASAIGVLLNAQGTIRVHRGPATSAHHKLSRIPTTMGLLYLVQSPLPSALLFKCCAIYLKSPR